MTDSPKRNIEKETTATLKIAVENADKIDDVNKEFVDKQLSVDDNVKINDISPKNESKIQILLNGKHSNKDSTESEIPKENKMNADSAADTITNDNNNSTYPKITLHLDRSSSEDSVLAPFRSECREKVMWTRDETKALMKAVEDYSFQWKKILDVCKDDFAPGRRVIDLKNKYNMITKSNTFYTTPKRQWILLEGDSPKLNENGEIFFAIERFPYNAAKKIAKTQKFSGYESYMMKIAEAGDINNYHLYLVTVTQDTYKIKKMRVDE